MLKEKAGVIAGNIWNALNLSLIHISFGVVTKKLLKAFDIDNEVYYADLNWKELMKAIRSVKISYKEISKFPAVKRDLACLLYTSVLFAGLREQMTLVKIPKGMQGTPIALITAGLLAMAFMGFSGVV